MDALDNLRKQAYHDKTQRWHPEMEPTEAEQLVDYINSLIMENLRLTAISNEYSWVKNPDRMGR